MPTSIEAKPETVRMNFLTHSASNSPERTQAAAAANELRAYAPKSFLDR
jgi:hypothetical protein